MYKKLANFVDFKQKIFPEGDSHNEWRVFFFKRGIPSRSNEQFLK